MHTWISKFIEKYEPCNEAVNWLKATNYPTIANAWKECGHGDWMLWALSRMRLLDNKIAVKISCRIIREIGEGIVWGLLTDERSRNAVEFAEAWLVGNATLEEVRLAAAAAAAAYTAAYDAYADAAYTDAAYAAAAAADTAAYDAYADAAYAAAAAAAAADTAVPYSITRKSSLKEIAEIIRQEIPITIFN